MPANSLNIIICGTPGAGKTRLTAELKKLLPQFQVLNLSKFAIENGCTSAYDETLDTHEIDEEKLSEKLDEALVKTKQNIIECIHADMIPMKLVDWVFVCRVDNTILYDRLKARNYSELKIAHNVQAEIFQTILDEARECFGDKTVTELKSNNEDDLAKNVEAVRSIILRSLGI